MDLYDFEGILYVHVHVHGLVFNIRDSCWLFDSIEVKGGRGGRKEEERKAEERKKGRIVRYIRYNKKCHEELNASWKSTTTKSNSSPSPGQKQKQKNNQSHLFTRLSKGSMYVWYGGDGATWLFPLPPLTRKISMYLWPGRYPCITYTYKGMYVCTYKERTVHWAILSNQPCTVYTLYTYLTSSFPCPNIPPRDRNVSPKERKKRKNETKCFFFKSNNNEIHPVTKCHGESL